MGSSKCLGGYERQLLSVKTIIAETNRRIISDPPDPLFLNNTNFFVKSYLVIICSYLEAYLQDSSFEYAELLTRRIDAAKAPKNFIHWRVLEDKFSPDSNDFGTIDLLVKKEDISEIISPNPHKTLKLFNRLGVNLMDVDGFRNHKSVVGSVVSKRNNIVHHNDQASDITMGDLLSYIDVFLIYIKEIDSRLF